MALLLLVSCSVLPFKPRPQAGVYHQVKSGETLWSIAQAYSVKLQEITEANKIGDPTRLEAGSIIFIPGAKGVIAAPTTAPRLPEPALKPAPDEGAGAPAKTPSPGKVPPVPPREEKKVGEEPPGKAEVKTEGKAKREGKGPPEENIPADRGRFVWPVTGEISSTFGPQPGGMFHNGIKITAKEGAVVVAASSGTVIFSSSLKDFGETIILKHEEDLATVYTNLGSRTVKVTDQVKRGEPIGRLDNPEKKGRPTLGFEVRIRGKAYNPLLFLP